VDALDRSKDDPFTDEVRARGLKWHRNIISKDSIEWACNYIKNAPSLLVHPAPPGGAASLVVGWLRAVVLLDRLNWVSMKDPPTNALGDPEKAKGLILSLEKNWVNFSTFSASAYL
jgi:hypothetical protein